MQKTKKMMSAEYIGRHMQLFACPFCAKEMQLVGGTSLICKSQHTFDLAKQGYVNLLTHSVDSMYSKQLFESRKVVIDSGLYTLLHKKLSDLLQVGGDSCSILDTGCGEGSQLFYVKSIIQESIKDVVAVGIDIAKEGIQLAARHYDDMIWCVGDLAKSPYRENSFDVILNILSPANYTEFKRLLKDDGKLIKVVPQEHYLKELRQHFFKEEQKSMYSNEQVIERFKESFAEVEVHRITYTVPLNEDLVPHLMQMTPMGWHKVGQTEESDATTLKEITIDLDVLVGS